MTEVTPKHSELAQINNVLISLLGTKVVINKNKNAKGKIQIEFYSDDDFNRIFEIISNSEKN